MAEANYDKLNSKITSSVKWSGATEMMAKVIAPLTNMALARILAPEEFGILTTATMVISFADVFTDAGFQKYLIQKEFNSKEELYKSANVAFWTNFSISCFIWMIIVMFSGPIAVLVGNPGYGNVIAVAGVSLVLTSFSAINMALYKRDFNYKVLFYVRMITLLVPVFVTIPLALLGLSYWALIIGTICTNLINAVLLTVMSEWKPKLFYSKAILATMFGFSMWVMFEAILTWFTSWSDVFIVGRSLSKYYLGIYKNSITMVNGLLNIIALSTGGVLLSALSAIKNDEENYRKLFLNFQKAVSIILIPIGFGVFMYRDFATSVILGSQWMEASFLVGLWSLVNVYTILTGQYISIMLISKGKPKLSVLSQAVQMLELIVLIMIGLRYSFTALVICKCIARLLYGVINFAIAKIFLKFPVKKMLMNISSSTFAALAMTAVIVVLQKVGEHIGLQFIYTCASIIIAAAVYFGVACLFPDLRPIIMSTKDKLLSKIKKKQSVEQK